MGIHGLIGTGVRDVRRVIMVLNGMDNMQTRADESARTLDWALAGLPTCPHTRTVKL